MAGGFAASAHSPPCDLIQVGCEFLVRSTVLALHEVAVGLLLALAVIWFLHSDVLPSFRGVPLGFRHGLGV